MAIVGVHFCGTFGADDVDALLAVWTPGNACPRLMDDRDDRPIERCARTKQIYVLQICSHLSSLTW